MRRIVTRLAFALAALAPFAAMARDPAPAQDRYGFDVDIVLTPKAAATLAARHEALFLFASYYGTPAKGAERYADQIGQIDLAGHTVSMTVPGRSGPVHFKGPALAAKRLAMIDGPVMVNLNIASARRSSADNLLACDFIDGQLAAVRKAPVTLRCGLIDEQPATALKP